MSASQEKAQDPEATPPSKSPEDPPDSPGLVLPDTALVPQSLPETLLVLPVEGLVLFPGMVVPLLVPDPSPGTAVLEHLQTQAQPLLALLTRRPGEQAPGEAPASPQDPDDPSRLFQVGCLGRLLRSAPLPEGGRGLVLSGLKRLRVKRFRRTRPLLAEVEYPDEVIRDVQAVEVLDKTARRALAELVPLHGGLPAEMLAAASQVEGPARFADLCASSLPMEIEKRHGFLATFEVDARLRALVEFLEREIDLARLSEQARQEIRKRVETTQRELYLREQLKAIRRELGEEVDAKSQEVERLRALLREKRLPAEAARRAEEELGRLALLPTEAAEYHVIRTYLDWLTQLPWNERSPDQLDLAQARAVLEADHYGLEEVKTRFLEFLAVRKLKPGGGGTILCLAGPPGVGKTSLGQSIARALGRAFHRVSLGGMRDEAEVKGHRRTYVGAMPGKILQGLRRVGTRNPVFMLDEIDKLGADWRGDPSSALLEVLDPAQNHAFSDHYLDLPFDLGEVMFIATANSLDNIPGPLRDRLEVIEIPGYIPDEKREIARRYLWPRQLGENGIGPDHVRVEDSVFEEVVARYTREAGVRELERQLGRIARKVATRIAEAPAHAPPPPVVVTPSNLAEFLGSPRFRSELEALVTRPGIAVGLAWTPVGGDVLFIEALALPGRGELKLTGRLGEVMAESAQIARSVVRARAASLGIETKTLAETDLHLHVPAGSVPKDGPSAGITLATALVSLLTGRLVKPHLAMTGELTLRGAVLPIGGLRNKLVAAKRAGVQTVILPEDNRAEIGEVPQRVRAGLELVFVRDLDEVLRAALG
jgi:ATP-dependent Lon protease